MPPGGQKPMRLRSTPWNVRRSQVMLLNRLSTVEDVTRDNIRHTTAMFFASRTSLTPKVMGQCKAQQ
jgi:hypothetical protein